MEKSRELWRTTVPSVRENVWATRGIGRMVTFLASFIFQLEMY